MKGNLGCLNKTRRVLKMSEAISHHLVTTKATTQFNKG